MFVFQITQTRRRLLLETVGGGSPEPTLPEPCTTPVAPAAPDPSEPALDLGPTMTVNEPLPTRSAPPVAAEAYECASLGGDEDALHDELLSMSGDDSGDHGGALEEGDVAAIDARRPAVAVG